VIGTKIGYLEHMQIIGNAFADAVLLMLAHAIALDHNEPLDVRIRALRVMDEAMGESGPLNEDALREYHALLEIPYRKSE
jgi:hypothetical protein